MGDFNHWIVHKISTGKDVVEVFIDQSSGQNLCIGKTSNNQHVISIPPEAIPEVINAIRELGFDTEKK